MSAVDGIVLIVILLFQVTHSSQQVTLTCPSNEFSERTSAGPPGKRGAQGVVGPKGEQGIKGDKGQSDDSKDVINQLQERIAQLENNLNKTQRLLRPAIGKVLTNNNNCDDLYRKGAALDGLYNVAVDGNILEVYCEFQRNGHNWMVFQKRFSGEVDFFLNWTHYVEGFGQKSGEFWLGLKHLHAIVSTGQYMLRVDIEDWDGNTAYAEYSSFSIGNESTNYRLNFGGFSGNAGNALAHHNNRQFSTKDRDNDDHSINCASTFTGAWWYGRCHNANLNGKYITGGQVDGTGIVWENWKGINYSLKKSEMKMRPRISE